MPAGYRSTGKGEADLLRSLATPEGFNGGCDSSRMLR